ncbi:hypothetical protein HJC23_008362 [Cyclotella cryptica]|uniref:Uncharacterized protein n=1 Tax=Cyclotella cryptica TaxID=29204 RepID=A0ABD3Q5D4_9STRA
METATPNSDKISSPDGLIKGNSSTSTANEGCPVLGVDSSSADVTGSPSGSEGDFKLPSQGKARQRNSISVNAVASSLLAGLSHYDSDDDDGDGNESTGKEASSTPIPVVVSNPKASGGPQHRPLVGGFAAAAYEAARVDYYKKQGMQVTGHDNAQTKSRSRGHLPKYP